MKLMFGVWPNEKDPIILRAFLQSFQIRIRNISGENVTNNPIYNDILNKNNLIKKNVQNIIKIDKSHVYKI